MLKISGQERVETKKIGKICNNKIERDRNLSIYPQSYQQYPHKNIKNRNKDINFSPCRNKIKTIVVFDKCDIIKKRWKNQELAFKKINVFF